VTDADAVFDRVIRIDASSLEPTVTWGTTPAMSAPVSGRVPKAAETVNPAQAERALSYMGLKGGEAISGIKVDRVFKQQAEAEGLHEVFLSAGFEWRDAG
jgi:3-isopropylmalate/(R)-2-methylmalate dehydratase large subunit